MSTRSGIEVPMQGRQTEQLDSADLIGIDGNAFAIIGTTARALKRAGASREYVDGFRTEAMAGDYDHVIQTAMAYLDAEPCAHDGRFNDGACLQCGRRIMGDEP